MRTYDPKEIDPAEITPEHVYRNRRVFIAQMAREMGRIALPAAGALALAACGAEAGTTTPGGAVAAVEDDKPNTFEAITNYNNYYEFSTDKEGVAKLVNKFKPEPWTLEVSGYVAKPKAIRRRGRRAGGRRSPRRRARRRW